MSQEKIRQICPHMLSKKSRRQKYQKIPYTIWPQKQLEASSNVHQKAINLSLGNIGTLAYQKYSQRLTVPDQDEANFSKNFYLENCPDRYQLRNTLVIDQEDELSQQNAYILAAEATKQSQKFAAQRAQYLVSARRRAKISYQNYFQQKKEEVLRLKQQQKKWVINYYRKVEELIHHIFKKQIKNQDPNLQDKIFIKQNQNKTSKELAKAKISNPAQALEILTALRAVLLRKKISMEELRKDQQHQNKSVSASYMDSSASNSQDVSQGASFISAATNDATQQQGQEHFAQQFCDFAAMQKKWGVKDVQQIRNILRRLLCKNLVCNAQGHQMRQKKAAKQKKQLLKRQMMELGHKLGKQNKSSNSNQKGATKKTNKTEKKSIRTNLSDKQIPPTPLFKDSLKSEEALVKTNILKGGIYDAIGDKYERNRNYSQLFKKKKEECSVQFSFRQERRPLTSRT